MERIEWGWQCRCRVSHASTAVVGGWAGRAFERLPTAAAPLRWADRRRVPRSQHEHSERGGGRNAPRCPLAHDVHACACSWCVCSRKTLARSSVEWRLDRAAARRAEASRSRSAASRQRQRRRMDGEGRRRTNEREGGGKSIEHPPHRKDGVDGLASLAGRRAQLSSLRPSPPPAATQPHAKRSEALPSSLTDRRREESDAPPLSPFLLLPPCNGHASADLF